MISTRQLIGVDRRSNLAEDIKPSVSKPAFLLAPLFQTTVMLAAIALSLLRLLPAHGHSPTHHHDHIARNALPDTWSQPSDHAVRALFARDDFPAVGSDGMPSLILFVDLKR
jgi:hypothetical protein